MSASHGAIRSALMRYRRRCVQRRAQKWAVRLDGGALSARERARLKAWLVIDEHVVALQSAQTLWSSMNVRHDTSPASMMLRRWGRATNAFAPLRRMRFAMASAVLAVSLAIVMAAPSVRNTLLADSSTSPGEQRQLVLDDGSRVLLNSGSAVDVQYSTERRVVRLLRGEARFDVAPNANAPFVVETSGGSVTALGTVFVVRSRPFSQGGGAVVTGVEHRVRVEKGDRSVIIGPAQQTSWSAFGSPSVPTIAHDVNAIGWAQGAVQFEDAPLRDIVDELNRYTSDRIIAIGDARAMAVSGVFLVRDPIAGLLALESSGRLRLTRLPGIVLVSSP